MADKLYTEKAYKELQSQANRLAVNLSIIKADLREAVEALKLADGFLENQGYPESDPLVRGAIRAVLKKYQEGK